MGFCLAGRGRGPYLAYSRETNFLSLPHMLRLAVHSIGVWIPRHSGLHPGVRFTSMKMCHRRPGPALPNELQRGFTSYPVSPTTVLPLQIHIRTRKRPEATDTSIGRSIMFFPFPPGRHLYAALSCNYGFYDLRLSLPISECPLVCILTGVIPSVNSDVFKA